jgi:hypothetical protein
MRAFLRPYGQAFGQSHFPAKIRAKYLSQIAALAYLILIKITRSAFRCLRQNMLSPALGRPAVAVA